MDDVNKEYRLIVSSRAAQMLVAHAAFLANVNPEAADRLVSAFEDAAASLRCFPYRGSWLRGDGFPAHTYRWLLFQQRYLIIYQIRQEAVFIDYIVDCREDYQWLLQ